MTAVAYIREQGGTRSHECNTVARQIWLWAYERNIWLSASHIPTSANAVATLYMRKKCIFLDVIANLQFQPDIGLFASWLNCKIHRYVSWKKGKRKVQGVPQSQTAALPRSQEEKETDKSKHKPNKRTKSTKIISLSSPSEVIAILKGLKNTRTTHGKTYNKSPRRINHKATKSKTNTGTTALERSVEQPESEAFAAFSICWTNFKNYIFCPFSLIPPVLQKLSQDQVKAFLIMPNWPTQTYFSIAMNMLISAPVFLRKNKQLLALPEHPQETHKIWDTCLLSGSLVMHFQKQLQTTLCLPGEPKQINNTTATSECYLQQWRVFCGKRQINPVSTSVKNVLIFLTELFDRNIGYSALNTAKSALSNIISLTDSNLQLGQYHLVKRFTRGAVNKRPSFPKCSKSWPAGTVLRFLQSIQLGNITLRNLSLKITVSLALLSGQRIQTLHRLSVKNIHFFGKQCRNLYRFIIKAE